MIKPLINNVSDENQIKDAEEKFKYSRKQELDDLRHILSLPEGRRFVARYIFGVCGIMKTVFTGNSETYKLDGMRAVAVKLTEEISEIDSSILPKIWLENLEAIG